VLQEVAAARAVLLKCGSAEIDGYAFYAAMVSKSSFLDTASASLQSSTRSVAYLMGRAPFRPKRLFGSLDGFSLRIRPIAEVMELYHTKNATLLHDRVFALLSMSSDRIPDELLPDYLVPWEELLKRLVQFILGGEILVKTWPGMELAIIEGKGCILGCVSSIHDTKDDSQQVVVMSASERLEWTLQPSAKSVKVGDLVCLLSGAAQPMVIRPHRDYFSIIKIGAPPLKSEQLTTSRPLGVPLVWDWEESRGKKPKAEGYDALIPRQFHKHLDDMVSYSDTVTRLCNIALAFEDCEEYEQAEHVLREAIQSHERQSRSESPLEELRLMERLAQSYNKSNRGNEALRLLEQVLETRMKIQGLSHPDTTSSEASLVSTYRCFGHEEAADMLESRGKYVEMTEDVLVDAVSSLRPEAMKFMLRRRGNGIKITKAVVEAAWKNKTNPFGMVNFLSNTVNVDQIQDSLLWAARNGRKADVQLMLRSGASLKAKDEIYGMTPLSWAAFGGHEAIVRLLLEEGGALVSKDDVDGSLALASGNGHIAVVRLLLENGADIKVKGRGGNTPLLSAVHQGHQAVVKLLLDESGACSRAEDMAKLLWDATDKGHQAVVRLLLERGANMEAKSGWYQFTPLLMAAQKGDQAVVKLLLEKGADIEATNEDMHTPLILAADKGHQAVVKLLLGRGANIEATNEDMHTPLMLAADKGHQAVVKLLLEKGADIETDLWTGNTPLSLAARRGHQAVVKLLLERDADIKATGEDGITRLLPRQMLESIAAPQSS